MALITPQRIPYKNDWEMVWNPLTEADAAAKTAILGGRYTCVVEGNFGAAGAVELRFAKINSTAPRALDATNLKFTANGQYNFEICAGFVVPVVTAGTGVSVTVFVVPIP